MNINDILRTTALLLVVTIVTHLLRRRSAALRHMLWSFAIAGTVMIPVLTRVSPMRWAILPDVTALRAPSVPSTEPRAESREPRAAVPPSVSGTPSQPTTAAGNTVASAPDAAVSPSVSIDWQTVFAAAWLLVAGVMLIRLVTGLVVAQRIANRARELTDADWRMRSDRAAAALGVRWPVDVKVSDEVSMPFACGLLRPAIVIPASAEEWGSKERDAVLLHEFAHISRGDLAMNMLSYVVRSVYWVNPLAWLAAHKLRVEGERACDDAVLRGGAKASDYADHLLSIVRTVAGAPVPKVALAMARRSDFEGRLLAILEPGVSRARLTRIRAAGLAALFLAVVMPLAAMTPKTYSSVTYDAGSGKVLATADSSVDAQPEVRTASPSPSPSTQPRPLAPTAPLPAASATITALGGALRDEHADVRLAAVQSLGNLQDPAAITALARAMKEDTDARVREAAAWALGEIDDNRAVPHLLEALKIEKVAKVREKIVEALAEIDDASALGGVSAVLKDPSAEVRRAAVHALSEFEDQNAASALVTMTRDDDTEVRRRVAEALGQLENTVAVEPLKEMARDADAEVRANAIESLHHFEEFQMRLVPVFTAALKDSSAHVRQHAADALGSIEGLKKAPSALIDALSDANRDVRQEAASALGNIGDEAAVPALKKVVSSDSDTETRRHAVEALKEIGGEEAIQALMTLLRDPDPEVRKTAAEALGRKRGG